MKFSVIIAIYNRSVELDELLQSLREQTFKNFEVIVVDDGSVISTEPVYLKHKNYLDLKYIYHKNRGQGFSRNIGAEIALGDYLVFFDSDIIVPRSYFETVELYLQNHPLCAYGGEDKAHSSFTALQKAISYAMTSFLTTGGIRSKNQSAVGSYQIRSYNMGIKKSIFLSLGGFKKTNMGEDMELNARLNKAEITKSLIPGAHVYHKRRGTFKDFFKQIFSFGRTRIQLKENYNIPIKPAHLLPVSFVFFLLIVPLAYFFSGNLGNSLLSILIIYLGINLIISAFQNKSLAVGVLSIPVILIQHTAYGLGFLIEWLVSGKK